MTKNVIKFNEFLSKISKVPFTDDEKLEIRKLFTDEESKKEIIEFVSKLSKEKKIEVFWFLVDNIVEISETKSENYYEFLDSVVGDVAFDKVEKHIEKSVKKEKKFLKKMRKKEEDNKFYGIK